MCSDGFSPAKSRQKVSCGSSDDLGELFVLDSRGRLARDGVLFSSPRFPSQWDGATLSGKIAFRTSHRDSKIRRQRHEGGDHGSSQGVSVRCQVLLARSPSEDVTEVG